MRIQNLSRNYAAKIVVLPTGTIEIARGRLRSMLRDAFYAGYWAGKNPKQAESDWGDQPPNPTNPDGPHDEAPQ